MLQIDAILYRNARHNPYPLGKGQADALEPSQTQAKSHGTIGGMDPAGSTFKTL